MTLSVLVLGENRSKTVSAATAPYSAIDQQPYTQEKFKLSLKKGQWHDSLSENKLLNSSRGRLMTSTRSAINRSIQEVPQDDGIVEGTFWPLIPKGVYEASILRHETKMIFNTPKIFVHFRIETPGKYFCTRLFGAYRASRLIGRPGKNGRFALKPRSELFLTMCKLDQKKLRPDRVSIKSLKKALLKVRIESVTKDYRQRPLPECLHYSVVRGIEGIEAGHIE